MKKVTAVPIPLLSIHFDSDAGGNESISRIPSLMSLSVPAIVSSEKFARHPTESSFNVTEVYRTSATRRQFAQIARTVSGQTFEPPVASRILFGYYYYPSGKKVKVRPKKT